MGDFDDLKSRCLELCNDAITEIHKEVLHVETKTMSKREDVSNKATVGLKFCFSVYFDQELFRCGRLATFIDQSKFK